MRTKGYIVLILIGCFYAEQGYSQANGKAGLKRDAIRSERTGDLYTAITFYELYLQEDTSDYRTYYHLANLYRESRDYDKALDVYLLIMEKKPKRYMLSQYYAGMMLMHMGRYTEAAEYLTAFRRRARNKNRLDDFRRIALNMIRGIEEKVVDTESPALQTLEPFTALNDLHLEFSPFPLTDSILYFGSVREMEEGETNTRGRKIYQATKTGNRWMVDGLADGPFNDSVFQTSGLAFSPDRQTVYFTLCRKNWQNRNICEIYRQRKVDNEWQEPEKLPYPVNNDNYTTTHPATGIDLRTNREILYFVSNRPGGKGGMDIWMARYNPRRKAFSSPRNMGSRINSPGDEVTPFFDVENQTLYYSSDGMAGLGGFDIFRAQGNGRTFNEVLNMGRPINSNYDEYFYILFGDRKKGMFTSNRPGSFTMKNGHCCDDIFYFAFRDVCENVVVKGDIQYVIDSAIIQQIRRHFAFDEELLEHSVSAANVPVNVYLKDEHGGEMLIKTVQSLKDGDYYFDLLKDRKYRLIVKNYGYFDKVYQIDTRDKDCMDTIDVGETILTYVPDVPLRFNIYYEFDRARLTNDSKTLIDTSLIPLLELFPNAVIELGSHTDNKGTEEYNEKLSQRRAESVVKYLIQKGISSDRLNARGYGESMPVAPNQHPDGSDNPDGRQLNRRTEIRIIGQIEAFYPE